MKIPLALAEVVVECVALAALAAGLVLIAIAALADPATLLGQTGILPAALLAVAVVGFVLVDIRSARRRSRS